MQVIFYLVGVQLVRAEKTGEHESDKLVTMALRVIVIVENMGPVLSRGRSLRAHVYYDAQLSDYNSHAQISLKLCHSGSDSAVLTTLPPHCPPHNRLCLESNRCQECPTIHVSQGKPYPIYRRYHGCK